MKIKRMIGLITALWLMLSSCAALAQGTVRMEAEIGYQGVLAYMKEMPVRVKLTNEGGDVSGRVTIKVAQNPEYYNTHEYPLSLAAGAAKTVTLSVTPVMLQTDFEICFIPDDGSDNTVVFVQPAASLSPSTLLVGVLSDVPAALSYMNISDATDVLMRGEYWQTVPLSPETFPQTAQAMSAFSILVVDGVDVRALSEMCRQALDAWLRAGGVVLVGGGSQAAAGYPFFSADYSSISAGALSEGEDVSAVLLDYVLSAREPMNQTVMVNRMTDAQDVLVSGADGAPLIARSHVDAGIVFTCAFSLSDRPLSAYTGMRGMWQSVLLTAMPDRYQEMIEEATVNHTGYINTGVLTSMPVSTNGSLWPVLAICALFILFAGLGGYWILKKLDRREMMWVAIPVLSLLAVGALLLVGNRIGLNRPLAVAQVTVRQNGTAAMKASAVLGVAWREDSEMLVSVPDALSARPTDSEYYYDYDDGEERKQQLKYRYVQGDTPALGFKAAAPWTVNTLQVALSAPEGRVEVSAWKEKDGLHAVVTNNMEVTLRAGYLFTVDGYCSVPALAPGASVQCAILEDANPDGYIHDGLMLADISSAVAYSGDSSMYSVINAAIWPEMQAPDAADISMHDDERSQINEMITSTVMEKVDYNGNPGVHYVSINEGMVPIRALLNGEEITRTAQSTLLDVKTELTPVSPTGYVYYARGMLPAYEALSGDSPVRIGMVSTSYSYGLTNVPAFCFVIPNAENIAVSRAVMSVNYYYEGTPIVCMYNVKKNVWDEMTTVSSQSSGGMMAVQLGDDMNDYIDQEGCLFVMFKPGKGVNEYADIQTPSLVLEGSVR